MGKKAKRKSFGKCRSYAIKEDSRVMVVDDPAKLIVGMKNQGWVLLKMYKRFNLWARRSASGDILRECFGRYEIPKRVNVLKEGK